MAILSDFHSLESDTDRISMHTADFDFTFPEELIAYHPLGRGEARMMVVEKRPQGPEGDLSGVAALPSDDAVFTHTGRLVDFFKEGDALVLNDTRVLRARLTGTNAAGARVEALLLAPTAPSAAPSGAAGAPFVRWEAMVKPGKRFRKGDRAFFSPRLIATVAEVLEGGTRLLDFGMTPEDFHSELESAGSIPLPPYIKREASAADAEAYQSVFAENPGSVAAPTASLHLSESALEEIRGRGVDIRRVTLHVGAGTFRPVQSDSLEGHAMHSEAYVMSPDTAEALNAARRRGGRVWAVGTTAARVLETQARGTGTDVFVPGSGETRIFIYPGYAWKGVDGLLTNFHWPKSTLFMLVCSLLGTERARRFYREAFDRRFRLFSYGDAMLIR